MNRVELGAVAIARSEGVDWDSASESYKAGKRHAVREFLQRSFGDAFPGRPNSGRGRKIKAPVELERAREAFYRRALATYWATLRERIYG